MVVVLVVVVVVMNDYDFICWSLPIPLMCLFPPAICILHTPSPAAFLLFLVWNKIRWLPCDLMALLKDNELYFPRLSVFFPLVIFVRFWRLVILATDFFAIFPLLYLLNVANLLMQTCFYNLKKENIKNIQRSGVIKKKKA